MVWGTCYFRLSLRELKFGLGWLGTEESRRRIGPGGMGGVVVHRQVPAASWIGSILYLLLPLVRPFLISNFWG